MVYITGDTHGEHARFISAPINTLTAADTLIICGDFGYIFKDTPAEQAFLDTLAQQPYTICFVDGNHENFPAIFSYPQELWQGGQVHRIRNNLLHLMRGQVFEIEGNRFFTMGGAYSIDRATRQENYSYWQQEIPNNDDYRAATKNLAAHNNSVDYVLTHTAPQQIIYRMGYAPDAHDLELTGYLSYLMESLTYKHWYFGHWHQDQAVTPKFTALWFETVAIPTY